VSLYDHTFKWFKWGLNYKFDSYWGKAPRPSKAPRPPKKVIAPGPLFSWRRRPRWPRFMVRRWGETA
jgi:hypothetical protein